MLRNVPKRVAESDTVRPAMGLTPLEGLVGGTRSGSIDPTLVFHLVERCADDAGLDGIKVTKAEATLNKCVDSATTQS